MADIATRGLLVSLGGRSRIRVLSSGGGDHHATEVPEPEVYTLIQAEVVQAGRVTLTRDSLDELCAKVRHQPGGLVVEVVVVVAIGKCGADPGQFSSSSSALHVQRRIREAYAAPFGETVNQQVF